MFCLQVLYHRPLTLTEGNSQEVEELADAVAFLQGVSAPTYTLLFIQQQGRKTCTGLFLNWRGHRRGSCVEEPGSCWQLLSVRLHLEYYFSFLNMDFLLQIVNADKTLTDITPSNFCYSQL